MEVTKEQAEIIECPLESRILVTAGPGTGKTFTLIRRLDHLIAKNRVAPGSQILVLSFTRSAVREIKTRCKQLADDGNSNLRFVNVTTFDSYASRLLRDKVGSDDLEGLGFDGRIEKAITWMERGEFDDSISNLKHVFVDEVQDLVDVRAKMVRTLLSRLPESAGFSLFGDPAQGIYNFQASDPKEREQGSARFYNHMRFEYEDDLKDFNLSKNHRAETAKAKIALGHAAELREHECDHSILFPALREIVSGLPDLPGKGDEQIKWLGNAIPNNTISLLCRDNGGALHVSSKLWGLGIHHSYLQGSKNRVAPVWIARIMAEAPASLTQTLFLKSWSDLGGDELEGKLNWFRLKFIERGANQKTLNLLEMNKRLRSFGLPDWFSESEEHPLVISSIHRAKGREFDHVVILDPSYKRQAEFPGEEARTLFVALTRAKKTFFKLSMKDFLPMHDEKGDRWFNAPAFPIDARKWKTTSYEVQNRDLDSNNPPFKTASEALEHLNYVTSEIKVGDEVSLVLKKSITSECYEIQHRERVIGYTTNSFVGSLRRLIKSRWKKGDVPPAIEGVRVQGIQTLFVDPLQVDIRTVASPLGSWVTPVIGGLAYLKYK